MLVVWCGSCGSFVCSSSVYRVSVLGGHSFWMSVSPLVVLSILLVSLVSYRHFIMWMFYELHRDVCTCGLSLSLPRVSTVGKLRLVVVAVQGAPPDQVFIGITKSETRPLRRHVHVEPFVQGNHSRPLFPLIILIPSSRLSSRLHYSHLTSLPSFTHAPKR